MEVMKTTPPIPQAESRDPLERVMCQVDGVFAVDLSPSQSPKTDSVPIVFSVLPAPWKRVIEDYAMMPCSSAFLESCFSTAGKIQPSSPNASFKIFSRQLLIRRNKLRVE